MSLLDLFRDPYLRQIEGTGAEAVGRFHAKRANIEQTRQQALDKLKVLAVQQAITIERLNHPSFCNGPRLDDPIFKRKVQDTAATLLFESHLHLSVSG